jgi:23S rRNA pseudouridine2605 synthase
MPERLQKILAHAGVASRRHAEQLIAEGRVRVNGHVVRQMGVQADPRTDTITVDGQRIRKAGRLTYILLNKPRNVMTTVEDPGGRTTVMDLIGKAPETRLYPVGRLDFGSEGLLILTNDGDFTRFMTRAGGAPKVYGVKVSGVPSPRDLDRLRRGIRVEGRSYRASEIRLVSQDSNSWLEVTLHEGHNRQIRRMLEAIGHRVMRLRRNQIGFLTAPTLKPGEWRHLTAREVQEFYRRYGQDR